MRFLKWKWILRLFGVLVLLACVLPISTILYIRSQGGTELQRAKAKITAEDPNWELDKLADELNAKLPAEAKNPYTITEQAFKQLPTNFNTLTTKLPDTNGLPVNCVFAKNDLAASDQLLVACDPSLQIARKMVGMPEGGRKLAFPRNPMIALLTDIQNQRSIAQLLSYDAVNHAMHNRPKEAVASARAGFGVPRAIGSEPSLIGQLVRMATDAVAAGTVERVLNLCEPKEGLAELQADLLKQSKFPYLHTSMRGERAFVSRMFDIMESGEILNTPGGAAATGLPISNSFVLMGMRLYLPTDHAFSLQMMSEYVAISQQPLEQQLQATKGITPPPKSDIRYRMSALLLPALEKVPQAGFRTQGKLAAASVAVACERYRQKHGQWPVSLDMISKDILPDVPLDPCSGKPIVYKRLPDRIIVYSFGPDGVDNGGLLDDPANKINGKDYGVQIYDVANRRQPAPPKPVDETKDAVEVPTNPEADKP